MAFDKNKKFNWVAKQAWPVSRASLEESTQRALATHQDVKIPDGTIAIDRDLLQDIRDSLDNEAANSNSYCAELRNKLDNLYPYLSCLQK